MASICFPPLGKEGLWELEHSYRFYAKYLPCGDRLATNTNSLPCLKGVGPAFAGGGIYKFKHNYSFN